VVGARRQSLGAGRDLDRLERLVAGPGPRDPVAAVALSAVARAVRPHEQEHVRESGHRHALVGLRTVAPGLGQIQPVAPEDLARRDGRGGMKTGGIDDRVHLGLRAVRGDDRVLGDLAHRHRHEGHVLPLERRVIVV